MKISLALHPARPLNRSEVWGCFTANLALPGSGSLVAGRAVGYFQLAVSQIGMIISLVGAVGFFRWYLGSQGQKNPPDLGDPFATLGALWHAARWPLAGVGIVVFAISWAAITSLQIMKANPKEPAPPRIVPSQ
jgi:multisubunit Na+/H+ antiporter MnhG subunit